LAHDGTAVQSLALTRWGWGIPVRPSILRPARFRRLSVGIEGQQQRGPLLDETDASVSLAVQAALVPCGRSQPACQVEGVLRPGGRGIPDTETGLTARPPRAHGLPGRGTAPVPRWRERLQRGLPLGTRATGRSAGGVDRPHLRPLGLPL